jgi:ABC-2 type transport system permease protein
MRKVLVIALREYNAAVRTKAFILSLLIMPLLMGGSILVQAALKGFRDTHEKVFAVIDHTGNPTLFEALQKAVDGWNAGAKDAEGKLIKPPFALKREPAPADPDALRELRVELSQQVRKGKLAGVLEVPADVASYPPVKESNRSAIIYRSNRLTQPEFQELAKSALTEAIRKERSQKADLSFDKVEKVTAPVVVESKSLLSPTGEESKVDSRVASLFVPLVLMLMMFMMVLMTSTPLMQGVVEEKMQRIAEVLLGSVPPFQLMLGKILGMTAVSLTIAAVYLSGAYWAAVRFEFAALISPWLIAWFLLFQTLASLMYGSLFIAIGAACTDMKETQNLLWPVMLLATLPMFMLGSVLQEPNSGVVTVVSFFPFATPMLMIARLAIPPGAPWWQPYVGIALVLATTLLCIYAAGRIFRVGILLQGKGANLGQLLRWVFRG